MALVRKVHRINLLKFMAFRNYSVKMKCTEIKLKMPWGHISGKEWLCQSDDHKHFDGHRVLGIHGWQDNCGTFDTLVPLLPKDFHFVAVDLPGHGFSSPKPEGKFYYDFDYVVDIERVARLLGWKEFSIIGHSMGGALSLVYSALFPSKVMNLVCIDTFNVVIVKDSPGLSRRLAEGIDRLLLHEERSSRGPPPAYTLDEAVNKYMFNFLEDSLTEESARILMNRGAVKVDEDRVRFARDPRLKFKSPAGVTLEQYYTICQKVQCNVLLLVAKNGLILKSKMGEIDSIARNFTNANCFNLIYVDGTHHVHLNDPEAVAPHINQFFLN